MPNTSHHHDKEERKLLTFAQEIALVKIIQKGKPQTASYTQKQEAIKATKELVEGNQQLVEAIADRYCLTLCKKYTYLDKHENTPILEDLERRFIKAGAQGIPKALDHYSLVKGYKFSTYATWWIKTEIEKQIEEWEKLNKSVKILRSSKVDNPVKAD